jgi:hypothetical protein
MNPNVRLLASLIGLVTLGGCYLQAGAAVPTETVSVQGEYVETEVEPPPPPPPPPEPIPPPPSPEHVWITGHFGWHANAYTWERGRYEQRPRGRSNWVPAHWEKRGHRKMWVDGHWG